MCYDVLNTAVHELHHGVVLSTRKGVRSIAPVAKLVLIIIRILLTFSNLILCLLFFLYDYLSGVLRDRIRGSF